jgi:hypothetical protein
VTDEYLALEVGVEHGVWKYTEGGSPVDIKSEGREVRQDLGEGVPEMRNLMHVLSRRVSLFKLESSVLIKSK